jgi:transposase
MPREVLTDNMAAIVTVSGGARRKHPRILQFGRDFGLRIRLCRARSPQTKGKVESSNRFLDRLLHHSRVFKCN